jgi:phosphatidate phosphatase APP1
MLAVLKKAMRLLSRPVRVSRDRRGVVVQAYRGFGSETEAFVMGRVLRQPRFDLGTRKNTFDRDLVDILRRFLRRGVRGAVVEARLGGATRRIEADRDGYFKARLDVGLAAQDTGPWRTMKIRVVEPTDCRAAADAEVFVPPRGARFVVISDIDDTVMHTGVANRLAMLWRLFAEGAKSRVAFPGVAAFYTALHDGPSGGEGNPMLYVSRAPWSLYEVLDAFFNLHDIPVGPILFLREWGLTIQRPLPRRAENHKLDLIRDMLSVYRDRPFVLIGDSGQHDPEIYSRVVRENPGRVLAVYIRKVSGNARRADEIEGLAREVAAAGASLLLAQDSSAMAEHAAERGLISRAALARVAAEKRDQEESGPADRRASALTR